MTTVRRSRFLAAIANADVAEKSLLPKGKPPVPKASKPAEGDFPVVGGEASAVSRIERKTPKKPKLTPEILDQIAARQGVKRMKPKSDEWTGERLNKAFERRDDYTLVDPREYYGALQVVGSKTMEWVTDATKGMNPGDAREHSLPVGATLKIRKLDGDMYSGWIVDKAGDINHLFDRLTLPALASQIMSVYEVYDQKEPQSLREVKDEVEAIRGELRSKKADRKQVATKMLHLLDVMSRLQQMVEESKQEHAQHKEEIKNNTLTHAGEIQGLHTKLLELRAKVEAMSAPKAEPEPEQPNVVTAKQVGDPEPCADCGQNKCQCYAHLTKPTVEVLPSGKVTIMFKSDWNDMDKVNFLKSMRYVVERRKK